MIGLDETTVRQILTCAIDRELTVGLDIPKQAALKPTDIISRLASGIAIAIEANNEALKLHLKEKYDLQCKY
jgi:hypothetical protein